MHPLGSGAARVSVASGEGMRGDGSWERRELQVLKPTTVSAQGQPHRQGGSLSDARGGSHGDAPTGHPPFGQRAGVRGVLGHVAREDGWRAAGVPMSHVDWSGKCLRALPPLAPLWRHTRHVTVLNLSRNALLKLAGLEHLPLLEHLDVSHNRLVRLHHLSSNARLSSLDASNNSLTEISGLHGCHHLLHLSLRGNSVRHVENLGAQRRLESLDLARNCIETLGDLSACVRLSSLDLSHNAIGALSDATRALPPSITALNLGCNELLDVTEVRHLCAAAPSLASLTLRGNPLYALAIPLGFEPRAVVAFALPRLAALDGEGTSTAAWAAVARSTLFRNDAGVICADLLGMLSEGPSRGLYGYLASAVPAATRSTAAGAFEEPSGEKGESRVAEGSRDYRYRGGVRGLRDSGGAGTRGGSMYTCSTFVSVDMWSPLPSALTTPNGSGSPDISSGSRSADSQADASSPVDRGDCRGRGQTETRTYRSPPIESMVEGRLGAEDTRGSERPKQEAQDEPAEREVEAEAQKSEWEAAQLTALESEARALRDRLTREARSRRALEHEVNTLRHRVSRSRAALDDLDNEEDAFEGTPGAHQAMYSFDTHLDHSFMTGSMGQVDHDELRSIFESGGGKGSDPTDSSETARATQRERLAAARAARAAMGGSTRPGSPRTPKSVGPAGSNAPRGTLAHHDQSTPGRKGVRVSVNVDVDDWLSTPVEAVASAMVAAAAETAAAAAAVTPVEFPTPGLLAPEPGRSPGRSPMPTRSEIRAAVKAAEQAIGAETKLEAVDTESDEGESKGLVSIMAAHVANSAPAAERSEVFQSLSQAEVETRDATGEADDSSVSGTVDTLVTVETDSDEESKELLSIMSQQLERDDMIAADNADPGVEVPRPPSPPPQLSDRERADQLRGKIDRLRGTQVSGDANPVADVDHSPLTREGSEWQTEESLPRAPRSSSSTVGSPPPPLSVRRVSFEPVVLGSLQSSPSSSPRASQGPVSVSRSPRLPEWPPMQSPSRSPPQSPRSALRRSSFNDQPSRSRSPNVRRVSFHDSPIDDDSDKSSGSLPTGDEWMRSAAAQPSWPMTLSRFSDPALTDSIGSLNAGEGSKCGDGDEASSAPAITHEEATRDEDIAASHSDTSDSDDILDDDAAWARARISAQTVVHQFLDRSDQGAENEKRAEAEGTEGNDVAGDFAETAVPAVETDSDEESKELLSMMAFDMVPSTAITGERDVRGSLVYRAQAEEEAETQVPASQVDDSSLRDFLYTEAAVAETDSDEESKELLSTIAREVEAPISGVKPEESH